MSMSQAVALTPLTSVPLLNTVETFIDDQAAFNERKKSTTKEGLWKLLNTAMAILSHAHLELDKAHQNIATLQDKIAQLETLAMTDTMTGLKNRRGFEDAFAQELDRATRGLSCGVMVLIDLDNFKMINDTHSHLAGDACLKLVGETLANEIRVMDTAARLGGDEFVLLLATASVDGVLNRVQQIAQKLNSLSVVWNGVEIPIRASIGLKEYGQKDDTAQAIYHAADLALYADKAARKENRKAS